VSRSDAAKFWEQAAHHLRSVLHPDVFERWIAVIEPIEVDEHRLVLHVDNDFYQGWLEEHYLPLIQDAVASVSGTKLAISFDVSKQHAAPGASAADAPPKKKPSLRERLTRRSRPTAQLNEKFTFDDFVVGPCNSFAHAASLAVAQAPARAYNPLFIYGGVGLGKTHLMQAIGHYVERNSKISVCYLSSEAFTNEYIQALQSRTLVQFRKKYRHTDLLLIDDIHFLAGKERLQEEFFHTFNTLFDAHKQIVMTSDKPASDIRGLEQRLVSRFEWGLVTELEPPDLETRIAILRQKHAQCEIVLPDDALLFIAEKVRSNIRRLEGSLIRAVSYVSLTGAEPTRESLQHLLRDTLDEELQEMLTIPAIQKAVAQHYDVRVADLTGKRRQQSIALPRQVAMYLCRHMTDASLPEIGASFSRTHATVLHAYKRITQRFQSDPVFQGNLRNIAKHLGKEL
jgi:chromosomal replication initiator protein